MLAPELLHSHLAQSCPEIYQTRLSAVMDVALSLQKGQDLRLTELGRHLKSSSRIKHRVKKVDRLESNRHLHGELDSI